MSEALGRWKLFPREIESDLSLYHRRDIGEWFEGRMSSRKLLTLLDGLPSDSWYKISVEAFLKEYAEEQERLHRQDVKSVIFAQLQGQILEPAKTE